MKPKVKWTAKEILTNAISEEIFRQLATGKEKCEIDIDKLSKREFLDAEKVREVINDLHLTGEDTYNLLEDLELVEQDNQQ